MSKINWIGSICIAGLATVLATPNLDGIPNKPRGGDYGAPRLLIEASPDAERQHLSWPKVVATERGTIVVAFIAGQSHHIGGVPAVSLSTDGGEDFSEFLVIDEFGVDRSAYHGHAAHVVVGPDAHGALVF